LDHRYRETARCGRGGGFHFEIATALALATARSGHDHLAHFAHSQILLLLGRKESRQVVMSDLFVIGFFAGLALAIPVGPMAIMLINTTLEKGWRTGVAGASAMATVCSVPVSCFG
jgi:hypothetical protein